MAFSGQYQPQVIFRKRPDSILIGIFLLWGIVGASLVLLLLGQTDLADSLNKYYLVPWAVACGAVIAAPSVYMLYKGNFDPFHPLVVPAWSYLFPAFCLGGIVLAAGLSEPYFLAFVQDERYNLPLTLVYVMLGYMGLVAGYYIPFGRKVGEKISSYLPVWNWNAERILLPALVLMAVGFANTILGFALGILGFQRVEEIGVFDGLIFLMSLFWMQASFLLWLYIFRSEHFNAKHWAILALLLTTALTRSAFQGNRGSLISILIMVGFAYALSGRKFTLKLSVIGGILVSLALIGGMIYGTTFRSIKQTQDQSTIGQMADVIFATGDKVISQDLGSTIVDGFAALAERIDSVSSLAVIVSNYEQLAAYEEAWGISNNIWNEVTTFFIPRVIWPNKPISIEPKQYADLYFNYSENSFTMTPMGDLLRNFGPIGVPLGMIVLGLIIRLLYSSLIEGQTFTFWRATLFYMMFSTISFEGTYGLIVPMMFKVGATAVLGLILVRLLAGAGKKAL